MAKLFQLVAFLVAGLYFLSCAVSPLSWHFIDSVNLVFHEAGHWIFWPFGEFMGFLGGSLNQVLIPLLIAGYFFYQQQKLSACAVLMWAGQSLINVSVYAGDAFKMQLPLLGGDSSIHDWNWLLIYLGQLRHAQGISQSINFIGWMILLAGIFGGVYLLFAYQTYKTENE